MNTLHQCHWQNQNHFTQYMPLLGRNDALVICGDLSTADINWLSQQLKASNTPWHLVIDHKHPHNAANSIDHQQWLNLILDYRNSLAWK